MGDFLSGLFKPKLKTYDFRQWQINVANIPLSGLSEEGFTIEWSGDWFQPRTGLDGELTRNYTHNPIARITFRLRQSADSNADLALLLLADPGEQPKVSTSTFPISIISLRPNGGTFNGNDCWIERPPTVTGSREISELEWVIFCPDLPPLIS